MIIDDAIYPNDYADDDLYGVESYDFLRDDIIIRTICGHRLSVLSRWILRACGGLRLSGNRLL
jgi:hypothetical protein